VPSDRDAMLFKVVDWQAYRGLVLPVYTERGSQLDARVVAENDGVVADFNTAKAYKGGTFVVLFLSLTLLVGGIHHHVPYGRELAVLSKDHDAPTERGHGHGSGDRHMRCYHVAAGLVDDKGSVVIGLPRCKSLWFGFCVKFVVLSTPTERPRNTSVLSLESVLSLPVSSHRSEYDSIRVCRVTPQKCPFTLSVYRLKFSLSGCPKSWSCVVRDTRHNPDLTLHFVC
jgi:hypothetical protein